jgi:methyl-accepting chemotaxis protein
MRFEDSVRQVSLGLAALVSFLSGAAPEPDATVEELQRIYVEVKAKSGRDAVAVRLGMNEADLVAFEGSLREAVRRIGRLAPDAPAIERRNAEIAALRLLSWLESIAARDAGFYFAPQFAERADDVGRKQVRALELILRSLITERYETQSALTARLTELLSEKAVEQFLASADKGDIISGTTFSDLASLLVSTQEYPGYDPLFKDTPFLTLLKEKRVTIRTFLDDIRRIRNALAHNRRVSPIQLQLLGLYYEELSEPLQEAFDHGCSKVNPDAFMGASAEALRDYFGRLTADTRAVRDDISELRADLTGRLEDIKGDTSSIRATTARIETETVSVGRRQRVILLAVATVLAGLGVVGWLVFGQSGKLDDVVETTKRVEESTEAVSQTAARVEDSTKRVEESTAAVGQTAARVEESAKRVEARIAEIAAGFAKIDRGGGLVANPTRPEEHYHNALVYTEMGDAAKARAEYLAMAELGVSAIDVYLRLARLVQTREGLGASHALLRELSERFTMPSVRAVFAMQFSGDERLARIYDFVRRNQKTCYSARYLLAQAVREDEMSASGLLDAYGVISAELQPLEEFLAADERGLLSQEFIDQEVLGSWLDDARARVVKLRWQAKEALQNIFPKSPRPGRGVEDRKFNGASGRHGGFD